MSKTKLFIVTTPLILLFLFQPLLAQTTYPTYDDIYINDFANVINVSDETRIRSAFSTWKAETGVEATVLTINSFRDYDTGDETFEAFATNLFNEWGIGSSDTHDGILLLVGVEDRMVRIEVGTAYENVHNTAMKRIIDNTILPQFRSGNMSLGIRLGSLDIVNHFNPQTSTTTNSNSSGNSSSNVSSAPVSQPRTTTSTTRSTPNLSEGLFAFLCGGGLFSTVLGFFGFSSYQRNRKRDCENCGTAMARLNETADDEYLSEGQRVEEILGSVDYDIWQCPHCHEHELHQYAAWFSSYSKCPDCTHKTLASKSWITEHPTYTSTGTRKTKKTCRHCDYTRTSTSTIPRKQRTENSSSSSSFSSSRSSSSSSSSSRSFGGGSSSGSGSSGKW